MPRFVEGLATASITQCSTPLGLLHSGAAAPWRAGRSWSGRIRGVRCARPATATLPTTASTQVSSIRRLRSSRHRRRTLAAPSGSNKAVPSVHEEKAGPRRPRCPRATTLARARARDGHGACPRCYCFCFPCPPRLESVSTLIWRGFVSAFLGRKMRSTPSRLCAVTCPTSTVEGRVKLRLKLP